MFNQHVLIKLPSGTLKLVEMKPNGVLSLGKFGACYINDIVGYPLGTTFNIQYDGTEVNTVRGSSSMIGKVKIQEHQKDINSNQSLETCPHPIELNKVENSDNNMNLFDMGDKIQKMDHMEIEQMKSASRSGNEIISKIIESHGNFHNKTIHSQEKYLKRKKQKFEKFFTVEYLSSSELLRFLFEKGDVMRVMDLSEESLGMILNLANIHSKGTYLCMDETGGLVVYAVMERMFGGIEGDYEGKIVLVHENEHPNLDLLKFSNYSNEFITKHVKTISLLNYFEPPILEEVNKSFTPLEEQQLREMKSNKRGAYYRRLKRYYADLEIVELSSNIFYNGLVVATTLQLHTLIPKLATRVRGSRPIVCYSQFREPLLELAHTLYNTLEYLAPTILETRCRPYQTIRGKLHPLMTMRGGGGYIMWCHKVIPHQD